MEPRSGFLSSSPPLCKGWCDPQRIKIFMIASGNHSSAQWQGGIGQQAVAISAQLEANTQHLTCLSLWERCLSSAHWGGEGIRKSPLSLASSAALPKGEPRVLPRQWNQRGAQNPYESGRVKTRPYRSTANSLKYAAGALEHNLPLTLFIMYPAIQS